MRSLVGLGPFFIALTAACTSGLSSYKGPDGSAGGTGDLATSSDGSSSSPGGTTSSMGGATSITGGMPGLFGGTTSSVPNTGGIPPMAGTSGTGGASSTGGIPLSSGTSSTGGISSTGGVLLLGGTSSTGGTGWGGTSASSIPLVDACANLTCLDPMLKLLSSCQVGATDPCTQQATMTSGIVSNVCYGNGVKTQISAGMDVSSMTMTVKSGSFVCYSMLVAGLTGNATIIVVKDPSGTTVGIIAQDSTANIKTVTCPGGTPTAVDASCSSGGSTSTGVVPGSGASCTDGTCVF